MAEASVMDQTQLSQQSKSKSLQFPLLSEIPVDPYARIPTASPIDNMVLEKTTQDLGPDKKIEKDLKPIITDTNERLLFSLNQSKHQKAVQLELKALLEHEKKILMQISERAQKFSMMKEENKKKIDEWESDHNANMPFYTQYLKELMKFPENHCLTQEGVPNAVGQKVLYNIVEKTIHIANTTIVQLSMQNSLVNDIDLSLAKIRQFCDIMIAQIDNWLKQLDPQIEHQSRLVELWETIKQKIKDLKEKRNSIDASSLPLQSLKELVDRVSKLESTVDCIQEASPVRCDNSPESNKPPTSSAVDGSSESQRQFVCPPFIASEQEAFPTGRDYFGDTYCSQPQPPPQNQCTTPAKYMEGRLQRSRATPGQFPVDLIDSPHMAFPIPRAAMEKEGRERGQCPPMTPPTPPPPQYGKFMPEAASSPQGHLRSPYDYSQKELPTSRSTALLPKIQEDLDTLSKRNKKLEELVNNFRNMRKLLTEEMDKAVKLNQKLQRDLYIVAQEASKPQPPQ